MLRLPSPAVAVLAAAPANTARATSSPASSSLPAGSYTRVWVPLGAVPLMWYAVLRFLEGADNIFSLTDVTALLLHGPPLWCPLSKILNLLLVVTSHLRVSPRAEIAREKVECSK